MRMRERMKTMLGISLIYLVGLSVSVCVSVTSYGQDIHFTQFDLSPATLNPATTGFFDGKYRSAVNFRNQWSSVIDNPYNTFSASFDMNIGQNLPTKGALGFGLLLFGDKSGAGNLTQQNVMLSLAYHFNVGSERNHKISIGMQ
ncbi:MAG: type IX secretion system membrane protein PorP/SprF, partial [Bacteroidetes bacterium]|nr:type IX secretion system membrane protein PorP/SprF [Bacteroidota bacterium]